MKDISGSNSHTEQDELDRLLAHAPTYTPRAGFAQRVLNAIHEEETNATHRGRFRHLRPYTRLIGAAAACIAAAVCLLPLLPIESNLSAESVALDDAVLVDEVLDSIDDPALISAICCVSTGAYSISTGGEAGAY